MGAGVASPRVDPIALCPLLVVFFLLLLSVSVYSEELKLEDLIHEALRNSPEILASEYRVSASRYRIPQAKSLPDPMLMFGYQNDGFDGYSYGENFMSQYMFTASQMFPFPGKLSARGEMAARESEGLQASYGSLRLKVVARVKELYYDLLFAYKDIDIIRERTALFSLIEDAAVARYSAGKGPQQEVLMAQAEKYMLLEREEMQRQKIQSLEAMLNTTVGRKVDTPLGRPGEPALNAYVRSMDEMIRIAYENSPEIKARERMVAASEARVRMAELEYYPDFTVNGTYSKRGGDFEDMWSLSTAVNIPIFYKTKQRQGVNEARALLSEARNELDAARLMIASNIRDNHSMLRSAERLMELYRDGLIPKTYRDFESALAGYVAGKVEALTVISRLKTLLDFETLYWRQFAEREKAAARLTALAGIMEPGGEATK
jgi:outer membrane protein TolC